MIKYKCKKLKDYCLVSYSMKINNQEYGLTCKVGHELWKKYRFKFIKQFAHEMLEKLKKYGTNQS